MHDSPEAPARYRKDEATGKSTIKSIMTTGSQTLKENPEVDFSSHRLRMRTKYARAARPGPALIAPNTRSAKRDKVFLRRACAAASLARGVGQYHVVRCQVIFAQAYPLA